MELESSPFINEVRKVTSQEPNKVHFYWRMEIKLPDGKRITPMKVLGIVVRRNYHNDYGDDIVVELMVDAGTYHHLLIPNRDNLLATLTKEPLYESSVELDLTQDIEAQEMRLHLLDYSSAVFEGNRKYVENVHTTNALDVMTIKVSLIDLALEKVRMMTFDGIYRNVKTWELIRHLLTVASREITDELDIRIRGVDVYKPSNEEKKRNIFIPPGTRLTDVPYWLNENVSGVYNSGFGYYLQNMPPRTEGTEQKVEVWKRPGKAWFVYPTLDLNRFEASPKGLTLIKIPMERFSGTERTFRRTPNQLIVLIGEEAHHTDDTELSQLNYGNGVRYSDANKVWQDWGKTADNRTIITRKENVSEYLMEERKTGLNNVHFSNRRITANAFAEAATMARRQGMFMTMAWDQSDPGSIWPGMPVKYMYMAKGQPWEAYGIVQAVQHNYNLATQGITSRRHIATSSLLLFLGRAMPWRA